MLETTTKRKCNLGINVTKDENDRNEKLKNAYIIKIICFVQEPEIFFMSVLTQLFFDSK
jgi:hypothetical protein